MKLFRIVFSLFILNTHPSHAFDIRPASVNLFVDDSQVINPSSKAKVIVTSFKSFSCPPCKTLEKEVIQHVKSYFQDNPNVSFAMKWAKIGSNDLDITKRVLCGSRAGIPVSLLSHITYNQTLNDSQVLALGADYDIFTSCSSSSEASNYVTNDFRDLNKVGVNSVPTIFINEKRSNSYNVNSMIKTIEDLLK